MAHHASQAERLKAQLHLNSKPIYEEPQVSMTAFLGGKFGGRPKPKDTTFCIGAHLEEEDVHIGPQRQVVLHLPIRQYYCHFWQYCVTALGTAGSASVNTDTSIIPVSKGDVSLDWRLGAGSNTSMTTNTCSALLNVRITPPPGERVTLPPVASNVRSRFVSCS